jgi:hypothetical protein
MRKDLFIVGARLLGIWQLTGAVNSLALIVAAWAGFLHAQPGAQDYSNIHFAAELVLGLYLVLKTEHLYQLFTTAGEVETERPERDA